MTEPRVGTCSCPIHWAAMPDKSGNYEIFWEEHQRRDLSPPRSGTSPDPTVYLTLFGKGQGKGKPTPHLPLFGKGQTIRRPTPPLTLFGKGRVVAQFIGLLCLINQATTKRNPKHEIRNNIKAQNPNDLKGFRIWNIDIFLTAKEPQ